MAGRIRDEDIATVRERARIDDVVSAYVALRGAGGGNLKGLCPFHDERSPSFNVTPARGMYHCFGCGAGGDVIRFVMEIEGLGFTETVERLAEKYGVELRYEEGQPQRPSGPQRPRLVEAHKVAAAFYVEHLVGADAGVARRFLTERGFDQDAAERFGVGFSPRGGEDLYQHLRARSFSDEEVVAAGLVGHGGRGHYDRFRGRLMWPIRDTSGDTIGFGARRIFDDDRIEAKYLNTPETAIYKKSHVLYGIDLARREIARSSQAVIVEGYTDVMACHLAGVGTAIATCGTAFGDDHARVLRRLLTTHDEFRGEVIFTFDGDEAGQKAALKAFDRDQTFAGQTYVAVEPNGLDPCDLRLREGDEAVQALVTGRIPLYRFVLGNIVHRFDLERADGRVDAMREGARLVSRVRDRSKVDEFTRELAGMIGMDPDEVHRAVRRNTERGGRDAERSEVAMTATPRPERGQLPDPRDMGLAPERGVLKLLLQHPVVIAPLLAEVNETDFTHPAYRWVWRIVAAVGDPAQADDQWVAKIQAPVADERGLSLLTELAVEPLRSAKDATTEYAAQYVYRLRELGLARRVADVKARLQRADPEADPEGYARINVELTELERERRAFRDQVMDQA